MAGKCESFRFRIDVIRFRGILLSLNNVNRSKLNLSLQGKEAEANQNDEEDKYDLKKIISFPGFNVEAPHGTRDVSYSFFLHIFG